MTRSVPDGVRLCACFVYVRALVIGVVIANIPIVKPASVAAEAATLENLILAYEVDCLAVESPMLGRSCTRLHAPYLSSHTQAIVPRQLAG